MGLWLDVTLYIVLALHFSPAMSTKRILAVQVARASS
jgi:hypothetical protein